MKHLKKLSILIILLLLCGCESYDNFHKTFFEEPEKEQDKVYIGIYEPLTGSSSEEAKEEIKGIELAHKLYGSVLDLPVELIYQDNQSSTETAASCVENLVSQKVSVVLGSCKSTLSLAASDYLAENKLPAIGITCINPLITETSDYYFRVCPIDSYEADAAANYVYYGLKKKEVAVLCKQGDDFNKALVEVFTSRMKLRTNNEYSVKLVEYPEDAKDFSDYLFELSTVSSGIVYFPSNPVEAAPIVSQASRLGYFFKWVGSSAWGDMDKVAIRMNGIEPSCMEGHFFVSNYEAEEALNPTAEEFQKIYKETYGEDAIPSKNAALGFDAYLLALNAIDEANSATDTEKIKQKLYDVEEMEGASGSLTIDSIGNRIKELSIRKILPNGSEEVYVIDPEWGY